MTHISVHETFQQTLQGEGAWAGTPVDFIRLYGCPVGCPWCDTGYADGGKDITAVRRTVCDLVAETKSVRVVISGGEPFANGGMLPLIEALLAADKVIHIETSGAVWRQQVVNFINAHRNSFWITLSPKHHVSPNYPVMPEFWSLADEIKIVVESEADLLFYRDHLYGARQVFVQPQFFSPDSVDTVVQLLQRPQYQTLRLSLQTHKLIGVQ